MARYADIYIKNCGARFVINISNVPGVTSKYKIQKSIYEAFARFLSTHYEAEFEMKFDPKVDGYEVVFETRKDVSSEQWVKMQSSFEEAFEKILHKEIKRDPDLRTHMKNLIDSDHPAPKNVDMKLNEEAIADLEIDVRAILARFKNSETYKLGFIRKARALLGFTDPSVALASNALNVGEKILKLTKGGD